MLCGTEYSLGTHPGRCELISVDSVQTERTADVRRTDHLPRGYGYDVLLSVLGTGIPCRTPLHARYHPKLLLLERLRVSIRHGGFGLTSALQTSLAAFLGSMAAATAAAVFAPFSPSNCPLPYTLLLHRDSRSLRLKRLRLSRLRLERKSAGSRRLQYITDLKADTLIPLPNDRIPHPDAA